MKRKWIGALLSVMIAALLLPFAAFGAITEALETTVGYPPKSFFYSQLTEDAKEIYDALTDEDNLTALKTGDVVVVRSYTATFPNGIDQERYNEIYEEFADAANAIQDLMESVTDATAAFYRDRPDIFWTTGVRSRLSYLENEARVDGSISLNPGNTYTVRLEVILPLAKDWDGDSPTDRVLEEDIALLKANVEHVASEAKKKMSRLEQIKYINAQLCHSNAYNTVAAEGEYGFRYPWTPLSALDQLIWPNDMGMNALKPVCEGYAKAFQLICDEIDIPCILVSGLGGGGEHMWNYVQMEDGKWYAMDVTWNDSTGYDTFLLAGKDVMDEKHTTDSRFMQTEHMTFSYPVLQDIAYSVPASGLLVTVQDDACEPLLTGYISVPEIRIHIRNVGTQAEEITSVTVDGTAFTVTGPAGLTIEGNCTDTESYTVSPITGLAAGNYSATVTVSYGDGHSAVAAVFVAVKPASAPDDGKQEENDVPEQPDGESGVGVIPEESFWERLPIRLTANDLWLVVIVVVAVVVALGLSLFVLFVKAILRLLRRK